jgi:hypothetical protein
MDHSIEDIIQDLTIERQMGGMFEFQRTGVYPDYIIFYSILLEKRWKKQIKDEQIYGKLFHKRKPIILFDLNNDVIKVKSLIDDKSEWIEKDYINMMID